MRITQSLLTGKHTIAGLTDDDLRTLAKNAEKYGDHRFARQIKQHLINCVTDADLLDSGVTTAEEYIDNFWK